MNNTRVPKIGFTCAYTPLAMIEAAGFSPYRILPLEERPDHSGQFLHDNLCSHVKAVLNAALCGEMPELEGLVFVNSCDAMRRLADGWQAVRPDDHILVIDLPATVDDASIQFFATELKRLAETLCRWSGRSADAADLVASVGRFNKLCGILAALNQKMRSGSFNGGSSRMQELYNMASQRLMADSIEMLSPIMTEPAPACMEKERMAVFLFGNVLPAPLAFELFESCGVRVAGDDFCTGSRMFQPVEGDLADNVYTGLAASLLERPPCARTFLAENPGKIARDVVERAQACGAKGVIGHTLKFCDPYLARVPVLREELKAAALPFLLLEGDCSLRSIGQQRTRIEAFVEMLREQP